MAVNSITIPMRLQANNEVISSGIDHYIGSLNLVFTADAEKLASNAQPTVTYNNKHFHFGIPVGDKGDTGAKGDKGDTGAKGEQGERGIAGNGIASTTLNSNYTLTLNFTDGTSYTTAPIRGVKGDKGDKGEQGLQGIQGETGDGISSIQINADDTITINLDRGQSYTTGPLRGPIGLTGNGISSIEKTSTSGLVDTYTIAMTNASTNSFNVTNGYSPTATVVKNNGVATITLTDKNGTTSTTISDGANAPGLIPTNVIESILDGSYVPA